MDETLILVRAVHFGATALLAGGCVFAALAAGPELRAGAGKEPPGARAFWRGIAVTLALALAAALVSGFAWLMLLTADITGESAAEAWRDGNVWTVLTQTEFGLAWLVRLALAAALAAAFAAGRARQKPPGRVAALLAAACMGALAWSGHAAGTPHGLGVLHRVSDILHLVAAAAWVGALLPLVLLLRAATLEPALGPAARDATARFSIIGQICVATLICSGLIASVILVGGPQALVTTDYGQLLLAKIGLFAAMLCLAAVNRFHLTPLLPAPAAARALMRNTLCEVALGVAVLALVALLGTLVPAAHAGHVHMH